MLCEPRQRAAYFNEAKCHSKLDMVKTSPEDYCGHCLNAGGVGTVSKYMPNGWDLYDPIRSPETAFGRAGLCGDPVNRKPGDHMLGGDFMNFTDNYIPIVNVYKTGGTIDMTVEIDTNHNGFFKFYLCNLSACKVNDLEEKCFKKHCYELQRKKHSDCQDTSSDTEYECGPIDNRKASKKKRKDYRGRFYVPCRNPAGRGIHLVGGASGTMRYKLPKKVTCKHCVIQWYWVTANSCNPPGMKGYFTAEGREDPFGTTCSGDGGSLGGVSKGISDCGGNKVPEEFWSCADIQISKDGKSLGRVRAGKGEDPEENPEEEEEDKAKDDPEGTKKEAEDEMEDDIDDVADETPKEEKEKEKEEENGMCIGTGHPCDGTTYCCTDAAVCVFTTHASNFICKLWWTLQNETEEKLAYKRKNPGSHSTGFKGHPRSTRMELSRLF